MKNISIIISSIALIISISVAVYVSKSKTIPIETISALSPNEKSHINAAQLASGLGYNWHPIIIEDKTKILSIGLSVSTSDSFSYQSGSTFSGGNIFVFYKLDGTKLEYAIIGDDGRNSSFRTLENISGAYASAPSGKPIKINQPFVSFMIKGQNEVSLSNSENQKQLRVAIVIKG
jgi:hypothetical protein